MDFSKLSTGHKITAVGGAVLILNLFLPWYGIRSFNANAFDAGFFAWAGSLIAIAGAVILLLKAFDRQEISAGNFKPEQLALMLGFLGSVFIVLRFLTETSLVKFGLFIGIIASAASTYGIYLATKDAGLSVPGVNDFKNIGGKGDDS